MAGGGAVVAKAYPNVPALFGILISNRLCTLHELRTVYTFEDAMYMYEAFMVPKYNEWREVNAIQKKANR